MGMGGVKTPPKIFVKIAFLSTSLGVICQHGFINNFSTANKMFKIKSFSDPDRCVPKRRLDKCRGYYQRDPCILFGTHSARRWPAKRVIGITKLRQCYIVLLLSFHITCVELSLDLSPVWQSKGSGCTHSNYFSCVKLGSMILCLAGYQWSFSKKYLCQFV
jgi:hypothetical protein